MKRTRYNGFPTGMIIAIFAASFALPAQAQNLETLPRGEMKVHFNSGCNVFYNNRGRRTDYQGCSGDQVQRADRAIARRGGYGGGSWQSRPPYPNYDPYEKK